MKERKVSRVSFSSLQSRALGALSPWCRLLMKSPRLTWESTRVMQDVGIFMGDYQWWCDIPSDTGVMPICSALILVLTGVTAADQVSISSGIRGTICWLLFSFHPVSTTFQEEILDSGLRERKSLVLWRGGFYFGKADITKDILVNHVFSDESSAIKQ